MPKGDYASSSTNKQADGSAFTTSSPLVRDTKGRPGHLVGQALRPPIQSKTVGSEAIAASEGCTSVSVSSPPFPRAVSRNLVIMHLITGTRSYVLMKRL